MKRRTTEELWEFVYDELIRLNYSGCKIYDSNEIFIDLITFDKFVDICVETMEYFNLTIENEIHDDTIAEICYMNNIRMLEA